MFKVALVMSIIICLSGCSTFSDNAKELGADVLGKLSNSQISYNPAKCQAIKNQCLQGRYQKFPTSDGQTGCSCSK